MYSRIPRTRYIRARAIEVKCIKVLKVLYPITYRPGVPEHSAGNRINSLVQYRFLLPRVAIITLLQTGHK